MTYLIGFPKSFHGEVIPKNFKIRRKKILYLESHFQNHFVTNHIEAGGDGEQILQKVTEIL